MLKCKLLQIMRELVIFAFIIATAWSQNPGGTDLSVSNNNNKINMFEKMSEYSAAIITKNTLILEWLMKC